MLDSIFWDNSRDTIPRRIFYTVFICIIMYAFGSIFYIAKEITLWEPNVVVVVAVGALSIAGVALSVYSREKICLLISFFIVVIPLGVIIEPLLTFSGSIQPGTVAYTALITTLVTASIGSAALFIPEIFKTTIRSMVVTLVSIIIVMLFQKLGMPTLQLAAPAEYGAASIICLYIAYTMKRAYTVPSTYSNAIQAATGMYQVNITALRVFRRFARIKTNKFF